MKKSWLLLVAILAASTAASIAGGADASLTLDLGGGVSLDLVLVKAGVFRQGSPASESGHGDDETPREVTLTADYYIGSHEVTVGLADTGYRSEAEKGTSGRFRLGREGAGAGEALQLAIAGLPERRSVQVRAIVWS